MSKKKTIPSQNTVPISSEEFVEILEHYSEASGMDKSLLAEHNSSEQLIEILSSAYYPEILNPQSSPHPSNAHRPTPQELPPPQPLPHALPPSQEMPPRPKLSVAPSSTSSKTVASVAGLVTDLSFLIDPKAGKQPISSVPEFAYRKPPQLTMQLGSSQSSVMIFFTDSDYDREVANDSLDHALNQVTSTDVFRKANWPKEKHAFLARFQVSLESPKTESNNTIFMGDGDAFDIQTLRWDAGALTLHQLCSRASRIELKIDPETYLVALILRDFPENEEVEHCTELDADFLLDYLPIDYLRFDGVLQLGAGHKITSLAREAMRVKVLSVRDGTGVGGFRLPPCYRIEGLLLQGSPEHPVYLSQLFANQIELSPSNRVGRGISHLHIGQNVDLGEERFPVPPMHIKVLSVQYPHDLDKLSQLLETWEGSIEKLVLWGYRDSSQTLQLHETYPLFIAMSTNKQLPIQRISWIESKMDSQTFEWMQFGEIDCQVFGQNFENLSLETVTPGHLMMVLRGFGQSLSPTDIESYIKIFKNQLDEVPVMVKRLFLGTSNISPEEIEAESSRISSEQEALWSRIDQKNSKDSKDGTEPTMDGITPLKMTNPFLPVEQLPRGFTPLPESTFETIPSPIIKKNTK